MLQTELFQPVAITCLGDSFHERLAARELKRYWFARTGRVLGEAPEGDIVLGTAADVGHLITDFPPGFSQAAPGTAAIRTLRSPQGVKLVIAGKDPQGVLFGAYRVCEHWGVFFHLHGDSMPDTPLEGCPHIHEDRSPLFPKRGFHPFHNFPEGPDAWSPESYRLHFAQMAKMGLNFAGFHTYTDPRRPFEPQVWIGLPGDIGPAGDVVSGYAVENWHPKCGVWGYSPVDACDLPMGASALVSPRAFNTHSSEEGAAEVFATIARLWTDAFSFARRRGVSVCLGLEIPLQVPPELAGRLACLGKDVDSRETRRELWRGVFERIQKSHPLDLFWLYIPEHWVWARTIPEDEVQAVADEVALAQDVLSETGASFTLGVAGWAVGPRNDPLALDRLLPPGIPLAALSAQVGHLPISPFFSRFQNRGTWAIPWMEDDPRLTVPQLWAGRTLRDAADAHAMGCEGLLGIHWRTRGLAPQMAALARASWDQSGWNPDFGSRFSDDGFLAMSGSEGQVGGRQSAWGGQEMLPHPLPGALFDTASVGASFYRIEVPPGTYRVTCYLAERNPAIAPGARMMSVAINGEVVLDKGDLVALHGLGTVVALRSQKHRVGEERLIEIFLRQVIGETFVNAVEIEGQTDGFNQFAGVPFLRRVNCGGLSVPDPTGDWEAGLVSTGGQQARPRGLAAESLYLAWATAEFGPLAGPPAAKIFSRIDGNLPCITFMREGPGNCTPDSRAWQDVMPDYAFVDDFAGLGDLAMGPNERARFNYWHHHFSYFRAAARLRCAASRPGETGPLHDAWRAVYSHLIEAAQTPGDIGTLFSVEQQWRRRNLKDAWVDLPVIFQGTARIVVPVLPSNIAADGCLVLEACVLGEGAPASLGLVLRDVATNQTVRHRLEPAGRAWHHISIPARKLPGIFSYRVEPWEEAQVPPTLWATCVVEPEGR